MENGGWVREQSKAAKRKVIAGWEDVTTVFVDNLTRINASLLAERNVLQVRESG